MFFTVNFFLYVLYFIQSINGYKTLVNTTSGPVRGLFVKDEIAEFYSYRGIPYGESPTGKLRFMPPVPKKSWKYELDATKEPLVCPQKEGVYTKDQMSEDCLRLNVHVPAKKSEKLLPVLIYIYGGQFQTASGNDDYFLGPQFYIQRGIIFVSINHRIGALGFLSLETVQASGNAGLKDVILAMKWIKRNIKRFGGDPKKITLGGNSSGSAMTHYLLLTRATTGLFQRAMLLSGSALGYRNFAKNPTETALLLVKELDIATTNKTTIINKLKQVDAFDIIEAQDKMDEKDIRKAFRVHSVFVPTVEIDYPGAVITKEPREIIMEGLPQNVPLLVGFNANEGIKQLPIIIKSPSLTDNLNADFELCIPSNIEYPYGSTESKKLANSIRNFYLAGSNITNNNLTDFFELVTDSQFAYSIDSWINIHKNNVNSNLLYYYMFSFNGDLNWFEISNGLSYDGTSHADEIGYHLVTRATKPLIQNIDDRTTKMLDIFVSTFSNFVKYGNPSSKHLEVVECGVDRNYFLLNEKPTNICSPPFEERMNFWYNVYDKYYQYVNDGGRLEKKII